MSDTPKRVTIAATWHLKGHKVDLTTRSRDPDSLYNFVYGYQNALRLNDRPRTKLRITIEVVDE